MTTIPLLCVFACVPAAVAGIGTWTSNGPPGSTRVLAIDPSTPATLYAGSRKGVFKSTDGGSSWRAANTGLTDHFVHALAVDPLTPMTLYAVTLFGGVFKSTDGGGN